MATILIATHDWATLSTEEPGRIAVATYARLMPDEDVNGRTTEFPCWTTVARDVDGPALNTACRAAVVAEAAAQGWTVDPADVITVFTFARG